MLHVLVAPRAAALSACAALAWHATAAPLGKLTPRVTEYTCDKFVVDLAVHGTEIWAATQGGVVRWDALTGASRTYTRMNDGLPENVVTAIAAQSDGTIWIGTEDSGLGRYDPATRRWSVLNEDNSPLSDDLILALAVDGDDVVWVGTFDGGLNRIDGEAWAVFDPNNSGLSDRLVNAVEIGGDGAVWASVFGAGIDRFDPATQTWTNYRPGNTGTPPGICSGDLSRDPNELGLISHFTSVEAVHPVTGAVWIRNDDDGFCLLNGMTVYDGASWRTFTQQNSGLHSNFIEAVGVDADGDVWFADFNGLSELTDRGWVSHPGDGLALERFGDSLLLGAAGGVARIFNDAFVEFFTTDGLPDNVVASVAIDPTATDVRWLATRSGAVRMTGETLTVFDQTNSPIVGNDVMAVAVDGSGAAWIGTRAQGVSRFDGQSWTRFDTSNSGLHTNRIEAIAADAAGNVWFGHGLVPGLSRFDGQAMQSVPGFGGTRVSDIAAADNGDVWFATSGGATRYRDGVFTTIGPADGLPFSAVDRIDVAANGDVWMGSISQGVVRYDGKTFRQFTSADGLPSDQVRAVAVRSPDEVWVGTLNHGLSRYSGSAWETFDYSDGLIGDRVRDIAFDRFNTVWVGTEFGVSALHRGPQRRTASPGESPAQPAAPAEVVGVGRP